MWCIVSVFLSLSTEIADEESEVPLNVTDGYEPKVKPSFTVSLMVTSYVYPPVNLVWYGFQVTFGEVVESDADGVTDVTVAYVAGVPSIAGAVSEIVMLEMVPFVSANSWLSTI